ncbi:hypothetical protein LUW74_21540 [Actinomadura madurae]|uniref:hypothetical protein n=1 Tax=Actinomadura madurae TaxID=1993 RepID=UPI002025D580|nr:hypothetical protein [Actinomadura madurae]URN10920.1 hypothetical protein LUW74_21540 [Actinomadura madurae]
MFSLGCVLAFAATGRGPFDAANVPGIVHRVVSAPPDLTGVPAEPRLAIEACLVKDPDERPSPAEAARARGDMQIHDLRTHRANAVPRPANVLFTFAPDGRTAASDVRDEPGWTVRILDLQSRKMRELKLSAGLKIQDTQVLTCQTATNQRVCLTGQPATTD